MSLDAALNAAQLSLSANSKRIMVSALNVAGANDPNYSRKLSPLVMESGGVYAAGPTRAGDTRLYERYLEATSASARDGALLSGYMRLSDTVGDTSAGTSLVARLGALTDALTEYANAPGDDNLARAAVTGARDLAVALNDAASVVDEVRSGAAEEIKTSVGRINTLLQEFGQVNARVVHGSVAGSDVTDDLDRRDALVAQLAGEVGVSIVTRANNDMVLYTDGGVTLFETTAREVRAEVGGGTARVFIDGVQVAGDAPQMPSKSGKLVGLTELHNEVVKDYGAQLDTLAFGLIQAFREVDPAASGADLQGLFVGGGGSAALPASAGGLAGTIAINAAVDSRASGDPGKLRDGINYSYNTESAPAYADQLFGLLGQLGDTAVAGLGGKRPLDYAAATVSWVESGRKAAYSAAESNGAVVQLVTTSLSNARGVDINEETALQLELERLFAASAQLISVVDNMFQSLLNAVR